MLKINRQYMVMPPQVSKVTLRGKNTKRFLTIHETGGVNVKANNYARAQFNGNTGAFTSWHYSVDENEIYQSFEHSVRCVHAGPKKGKNSLVGYNGNIDSIGIEICQTANFKGAVAMAARLAAKILKDEGIPISRMVQHWHWSQKDCPQRIRSGKYGVTWSSFVQLVQKELNSLNNNKEENEMTVYKTTTNLNVRATAGVNGKLLKTLPKDTVVETTKAATVGSTKWVFSPLHGGWLSSTYLVKHTVVKSTPQPQNSHEEAWEWAKREGLMDGSNPTSPLTRQQFATVLNRFYKKFMSK